MAQFDWADPLLIEQELSDAERMVRDNARRFCEAELCPRVRDDFRHERFDRGTQSEGQLNLPVFSWSNQ